MDDELSPLGQLAEKVRWMDDREKLLLIDWLVDALEDSELPDMFLDSLQSAFEHISVWLPDWKTDYPAATWGSNRWKEFQKARNERLNLRLGATR